MGVKFDNIIVTPLSSDGPDAVLFSASSVSDTIVIKQSHHIRGNSTIELSIDQFEHIHKLLIDGGLIL